MLTYLQGKAFLEKPFIWNLKMWAVWLFIHCYSLCSHLLLFQTSNLNHTSHLYFTPPALSSPPSHLFTNTPTFPSSSSSVALVTDPTCAPCSGWLGRRKSTSARVETGTSAPSVAGGRKSGVEVSAGCHTLTAVLWHFKRDSAMFRDASVRRDPFLSQPRLLDPGPQDPPAWF